MKNKSLKTISYWLSIIVIGVVVGISLQFVSAWTEPSLSPPQGNVAAPINVGPNSQYKEGALGIGGPLVGYADIVARKIGSFYGNIIADVSIQAPQICIGTDCRSAWPAAGGTPVASGMYGYCARDYMNGIWGCSAIEPGYCYSPMKNMPKDCYCRPGYTMVKTGSTTRIVKDSVDAPSFVEDPMYACVKN